MSGRALFLWFYPRATGDPGGDRNARTLQFTCLLLAIVIGMAVTLDLVSREPISALTVSPALIALFVAAVLNRTAQRAWAGRIVILALLLCAILRVVDASDGFRSHAMLMFPGVLLLSVMLLDRASYLATAGIVILTVTALGIAEKLGLLGAIPPKHALPQTTNTFLFSTCLCWRSPLSGPESSRMPRETLPTSVSASANHLPRTPN